MSSTPIGFIYFSRMITRIKENAIRQNVKQIIFLLEQYLNSPSKPLTLTQISYCRNLLLYIDDPVIKSRMNMLLDSHFSKLADNDKYKVKSNTFSTINRRNPISTGNTNTSLQQNNQSSLQQPYEHDIMDNQDCNINSITDPFYYLSFSYYYFFFYIKQIEYMQSAPIKFPNTGIVGQNLLAAGKQYRSYIVPNSIREIEQRSPINYDIAPNSLMKVLKDEQELYNQSFDGPMTRALKKNGREDVLDAIYDENDRDDINDDDIDDIEEGPDISARSLRKLIYKNDYLIPTLKRRYPQLSYLKTYGDEVGNLFDFDKNRGSGILSLKEGSGWWENAKEWTKKKIKEVSGLDKLEAWRDKQLEKGKKAFDKVRDKAYDSYLWASSLPTQFSRNKQIAKDTRNIIYNDNVKTAKEWWNGHLDSWRNRDKRNRKEIKDDVTTIKNKADVLDGLISKKTKGQLSDKDYGDVINKYAKDYYELQDEMSRIQKIPWLKRPKEASELKKKYNEITQKLDNLGLLKNPDFVQRKAINSDGKEDLNKLTGQEFFLVQKGKKRKEMHIPMEANLREPVDGRLPQNRAKMKSNEEVEQEREQSMRKLAEQRVMDEGLEGEDKEKRIRELMSGELKKEGEKYYYNPYDYTKAPNPKKSYLETPAEYKNINNKLYKLRNKMVLNSVTKEEYNAAMQEAMKGTSGSYQMQPKQKQKQIDEDIVKILLQQKPSIEQFKKQRYNNYGYLYKDADEDINETIWSRAHPQVAPAENPEENKNEQEMEEGTSVWDKFMPKNWKNFKFNNDSNAPETIPEENGEEILNEDANLNQINNNNIGNNEIFYDLDNNDEENPEIAPPSKDVTKENVPPSKSKSWFFSKMPNLFSRKKNATSPTEPTTTKEVSPPIDKEANKEGSPSTEPTTETTTIKEPPKSEKPKKPPPLPQGLEKIYASQYNELPKGLDTLDTNNLDRMIDYAKKFKEYNNYFIKNNKGYGKYSVEQLKSRNEKLEKIIAKTEEVKRSKEEVDKLEKKIDPDKLEQVKKNKENKKIVNELFEKESQYNKYIKGRAAKGLAIRKMMEGYRLQPDGIWVDKNGKKDYNLGNEIIAKNRTSNNNKSKKGTGILIEQIQIPKRYSFETINSKRRKK